MRSSEEPVPGIPWPDVNGRPNPSTPEGEIMRVGDLARGLRTNPRGVSRALRMLAALVAAVAAMIVVTLVF